MIVPFDDLELVHQSLRTLEPPHTHKFPRVNAQDCKLGPHSTLGRERFFKAGPRASALKGPGFIGGIGLGLGYISPVSMLIKWFPDRRGMATGMAIMGFGGGAMIGAPLAEMLMSIFKSATSVGAWQALATLALIYAVFMVGGAFGYRLPAAGWHPQRWTQPAQSSAAMITTRQVHFQNAPKTMQFWLLWVVLCVNVSAGIGVIGMASPMLQEIFGGSLMAQPDTSFVQLDATQRGLVATIAAGFTGLLSLFNIGGRLFWAALSDTIGRKTTYCTFFVLGMALYAAAPWAAHLGSKALFVGIFCIIVSMYGGAFATIPAYLSDLFGTQFVGAIHGRLLTAWSTAAIIGPVIVNYLREFALARGVPREHAYDRTMYILAAMLVIGLIANQMVKPVADRWCMSEKEVAAKLLPRCGVEQQSGPRTNPGPQCAAYDCAGTCRRSDQTRNGRA